MATAPTSDKEARKANKRGAARLAAVQALYQMDLAGTGVNEILAEFESHWIGREVEGEQYLPAEAAFFRDIVSGVVREQVRLDPLIDDALARSWPLKRCARRCGQGPTNSITAATCRRVSLSRNMPTSPRPSSSAMRPAWSMPCSISWRAPCVRLNLRLKLPSKHAIARVRGLSHNQETDAQIHP